MRALSRGDPGQANHTAILVGLANFVANRRRERSLGLSRHCYGASESSVEARRRRRGTRGSRGLALLYPSLVNPNLKKRAKNPTFAPSPLAYCSLQASTLCLPADLPTETPTAARITPTRRRGSSPLGKPSSKTMGYSVRIDKFQLFRDISSPIHDHGQSHPSIGQFELFDMVWGDVCVSFYIYRDRDARCSLGNIITLWQLVRDGIDKGGRGVVQCVVLFVIIGNVPPRIEDLCVL